MSFEKWETCKFCDIFLTPLKNGVNKPSKMRGEGIKMINMREIFAYDRIGNIEMEQVPMNPKELENYVLEKGDLLFARQSLIASGAGKCSLFLGASEQITWEGHLIRARLNKAICDPVFYYYYFKSGSGRSKVESLILQTAAAGIRASELAELEIDLPPLPIQRRIASILTALDDKIELNRRMNETLEGMAQAVWGEWFGKSESDEWIELSEIVEFNPRVSIAQGEEAPYVEMKDVPENGMCVSGFVRKAFSGGSKFQANDTLLARITPCLENGKTAFVNFLQLKEKAFGSTEFIVMRAKEGVSPYFVYFVARDERFRQFAIGSMVGSSGRQRVQTEVLPAFEIAQPNADDMAQFHKFAEPIFEHIHQNALQSRTLAALRDALLPRLMRGEMVVQFRSGL